MSTLPATPEAPQLARRWLAECLRLDFDRRDLEDAKLLLTELVTNAFVHGCGSIEIRAEADENCVLIEVIDQGKGFKGPAAERDADRIGGWGLDIVNAVASHWGIHEGTSHVWFELERPRPSPRCAQRPASSPQLTEHRSQRNEDPQSRRTLLRPRRAYPRRIALYIGLTPERG